ncbi:hypothetical protein ACFW2X_04395 [Streptomyces antibioticus]
MLDASRCVERTVRVASWVTHASRIYRALVLLVPALLWVHAEGF